MWGTKAVSTQTRPAFYALARGRLARLRDAAPPAVHRVASVLRRHRRLSRARRRVGAAGRDGARVRARGRDRRARARRAERPAAAHGDPGRVSRRARRRSRSRAACAIGIAGAAAFEPWLALLVPSALFLVLAYNLELAGGRFHSDLWFALAWGGFPVSAGYAAVAGEIGLAAVLGRAVRRALSLAQRRSRARPLRAPARPSPCAASSSCGRRRRAARRAAPHDRRPRSRAAAASRRYGRPRGGPRLSLRI